MSLLCSIVTIVTAKPFGHKATDYWKLQGCVTPQIMSEM